MLDYAGQLDDSSWSARNDPPPVSYGSLGYEVFEELTTFPARAMHPPGVGDGETTLPPTDTARTFIAENHPQPGAAGVPTNILRVLRDRLTEHKTTSQTELNSDPQVKQRPCRC
jgi:hypothetical protein